MLHFVPASSLELQEPPAFRSGFAGAAERGSGDRMAFSVLMPASCRRGRVPGWCGRTGGLHAASSFLGQHYRSAAGLPGLRVSSIFLQLRPGTVTTGPCCSGLASAFHGLPRHRGAVRPLPVTMRCMFSSALPHVSPPSRVAVLGCGLVGGSLLRALGSAGVAVVAYDADQAVLDRVARSGLTVAPSVGEACSGADVVVVAVPPGAAAQVVSDALECASSMSAVTDVTSVKGPVVRGLASSGRLGDARLVLGHPMAGASDGGFGRSAADLFVGCTWVLTPSSASSGAAVSLVASVAYAAGAGRVVTASPEGHDAAVAAVSHLPQALSTLLAVCVAEAAEQSPDVLLASGGGFRDMSRLAASPGALWLEILKGNRGHVAPLLARMEALSRELAAALAEGDDGRVLELFARANRLRGRLEEEC